MKVLIRGGGDLASAIIHKLVRCGFHVVVQELSSPLVVRRTVAFCNAVYEGEWSVEGLVATCVDTPSGIEKALQKGRIPVSILREEETMDFVKPDVFIDATLSKRRVNYTKDYAPFVIGLGPEILAGRDADVVIETNRGHDLGRIIEKGYAQPNTHIPGSTLGKTYERVLRAPRDGRLNVLYDIGSFVKAGQTLAEVEVVCVASEIDGMVRGMLHNGSTVHKGQKIGDVDPRGEKAYCHTISDKGRAIAGAVLEAIMIWRKDHEGTK